MGRIWLLNWIYPFCIGFKTFACFFFRPCNSEHKRFCSWCVSKQKATVWSSAGECAWMWMCINVQCMRAFQLCCVSCSNLSEWKTAPMASRKLWPLRQGPLPLLQLVPSVSASLFVELMLLTTEARACIPDLSIYSIMCALYLLCERIAQLLTFIISCCCTLFFWPCMHTQVGRRERWWRILIHAHRVHTGVSVVLHIKAALFCLARI